MTSNAQIYVYTEKNSSNFVTAKKKKKMYTNSKTVNVVNNSSRTAILNKKHSQLPWSILVLIVDEKWTEINLGYWSFETTQKR